MYDVQLHAPDGSVLEEIDFDPDAWTERTAWHVMEGRLYEVLVTAVGRTEIVNPHSLNLRDVIFADGVRLKVVRRHTCTDITFKRLDGPRQGQEVRQDLSDCTEVVRIVKESW